MTDETRLPDNVPEDDDNPSDAQGISEAGPKAPSSPSEMPTSAKTGAGRLFKSTGFRLILVGVLILLMLIPLAMVSSVVDERRDSYNSVLSDISGHWGGEQIITGPILVLPYTETYTITEVTKDENGRTFNTEKEIFEEHQAVLLPKKLRIEGTLKPEYRFRGIYQSLVYTESVTLSGNFENIKSTVQSLVNEGRRYRVNWDKALIVVGLSDTTGIARVAPFRMGDLTLDFAPGTRMNNLVGSGFHARLDRAPSPFDDARFEMEMEIKGSNGFRMSPLGELSEMHLTSTWAHPSFYGDILPTERKITEKGFDATWSVPHLVRSYPQYWVLDRDDVSGIADFSVGVTLFEPVTIYTEATRAVKYGILFIALTFLTLVLLEIITKSKPSMVQYVLIGAAMTVFYLLLIALAEHIGFDAAYTVASLTVIIMNTLYCIFVLSKKALAFVVTAVLSALYAVLYMALRAEDYALLTGSLLLVVAVAVTMFFTRNIHQKNE